MSAQRRPEPRAALPLAAPRVLFTITSSDIGGAEMILRELALRLDRAAFRPLVCSLRAPGRIADEIAAAGVPVVSLELGDAARARDLTAGALRLARLIDQHSVDVAHSFLYRANLLTRLAGRLARRRPAVVTGHHTLTPYAGAAATLSSRVTRGLSDCLVAPSQAVRQALVDKERVARERIVVIENGVDAARFDRRPGAALRAELGLAPETVLVGFVGRLSFEKRLVDLLASVAALRARRLPMHAVIIGDGAERPGLEAAIRGLGLQGHATLLGVRRDLPPLYAAMDVFALPSMEEAAPTVLLEAMACGRAVVATRVGGAADMVEDGVSGLLVDPERPAELTAALAALAADAALRARLGAAAHRRVRAHFTVERMVDRHAELYRRLRPAASESGSSQVR
ncbi:MAG: glycosyltransferase [Deltaproteobacteria bacterium]|nr:glycosyltransferase [Deltaproteobacteria bacterium]